MKNLLFALLVLCPLCMYGQVETAKDSLSIMGRGSDLRSEQRDHYLSIDQSIGNAFQIDMPDYQPIAKDETRPLYLNLPPITLDQTPLIGNDYNTLHNPYVNDYAYNALYGLSDNTFLTTYSAQNSYPGIGRSRTVNAQFSYQPSDWLVVSGGPYASKNEYNGLNYNNFGAGGSMKFIVSDRISFNGYGQYSASSKSADIVTPMAGMYPSSYYGGTVEVRISDSFGIEAGMIREFDPTIGKWTNTPVLAPVFYNKKKKK